MCKKSFRPDKSNNGSLKIKIKSNINWPKTPQTSSHVQDNINQMLADINYITQIIMHIIQMKWNEMKMYNYHKNTELTYYNVFVMNCHSSCGTEICSSIILGTTLVTIATVYEYKKHTRTITWEDQWILCLRHKSTVWCPPSVDEEHCFLINMDDHYYNNNLSFL